MKNVLERFENIVQLAYSVNKEIQSKGYEGAVGYGPRFRKMLHKNGKRVHSMGIYDYYTKKFVLFEMVNMVGQKDKIPPEFAQMERLVKDAVTA
mgnify:FL=1